MEDLDPGFGWEMIELEEVVHLAENNTIKLDDIYVQIVLFLNS